MKIIETEFNEMLNANEIERIYRGYPFGGRSVTVVALMKSQEEVIISSHFTGVNPIGWEEEISKDEAEKRVKHNERLYKKAKAKAKEDYELCRDFLVSNDPFISFEKFNDFGPVPPPNGK